MGGKEGKVRGTAMEANDMRSTVTRRLASASLVAAGLVLLTVNIWHYGLAAQSDIVVIFIVPLVGIAG